ncbi:hypothetical protein NFI96_032448 [Prochilodus magdalenae]|nr:hypothetical protein NFI96_032448 [Prochilodus magdalenae]
MVAVGSVWYRLTVSKCHSFFLGATNYATALLMMSAISALWRFCPLKNRLKRDELPQAVEASWARELYRCVVESVLCSSINLWHGSCSAADRKALQRVVKAAQRSVGVSLPTTMDIYTSRCRKRATCIMKDPTHPAHSLFVPLPSGRRLRSIKCKTNRLRNSFIPEASHASTDFTQSIEDDPLIDGPLISQDALESAIKREFQKLPTTWIAGILSVVHVAYVSVCVVLAVLCWLTRDHSAECNAALSGVDSQTVVLLGKVGLWLLVFVFERCVQHHHSAFRRRGYLQFYRTTRNLKRLPLLIHSAGNAAILVVIAPSSLLNEKVNNLSVYLLLAIICVELLLTLICLLIYTVHVARFNAQRPGPDINEEERSHAYSTNASDTHTETGFRDGSSLEDVVEKQADLIEYLKQHNTVLSKRLLALTSQQIRG